MAIAHKLRSLPVLRKRTDLELGGLPLVDIALGADPQAGEGLGEAHGIIAIGDRATGFLALGRRARGVFALGGTAVGAVALGGVARGLVAVGGVSVGALAVGGVAVGLAALGGAAAGLVAVGGAAAGYLAAGGAAAGKHAFSVDRGESQEPDRRRLRSSRKSHQRLAPRRERR